MNNCYQKLFEDLINLFVSKNSPDILIKYVNR